MNSAMNSEKQCVNSDFVPCTMNPCEVTVHAQEKKKKLKNVKRGHKIQLNPNAHKLFYNVFTNC